MAIRIGKIVTITAVVLVVITATVVGILFATHVLGKKSGSRDPPSPNPTPPGPFNPVVNCDQMPVISSFNRNLDGTYRISFSPISQNCVERYWVYYVSLITQPGNRGGETETPFKPIPGQSFIDVNLDLPFNQPWSPIKWAQGFVQLRSDGANGPVYSNKFPYTIMNI